MSSKMFYTWVLCGFAGLFVIALLGYQFLERPAQDRKVATADTDRVEKQDPVAAKRRLAQELGISEDDLVEVGGVFRPKTDFINGSEKVSASGAALAVEDGVPPVVAADANEEVSQLVREMKSKARPKAGVSALFMPEPFDRDSYASDPNAYLSQIRPGRIRQVLQPGDDVKAIQADSPAYQQLIQGETVTLRVKAESGMPVTFYARGRGSFGNKLGVQSVAADDSGVAMVNYTATTGVSGLVYISAASPVHSGVAEFTLKVSLPVSASP